MKGGCGCLPQREGVRRRDVESLLHAGWRRGASNIDPYAEGPTDDSQRIKEGAQLMIPVFDSAQSQAITTDPWNGEGSQ